MGRKHANPLTNPLHYASPQLLVGPPATYAAAQRSLTSYDYGKLVTLVLCPRWTGLLLWSAPQYTAMEKISSDFDRFLQSHFHSHFHFQIPHLVPTSTETKGPE